MTTPTSRSATSIHPTWQQLDELEALMQRMLELPVNQLDEPMNGSVATAPVPAAESDHPNEWAEDYPPPPAEWGPVGLERLASELPISMLPRPDTAEADASLSAPATEWIESQPSRDLANSEEVAPATEESNWAGEPVLPQPFLPEGPSEPEWMALPKPSVGQQTSNDSGSA